MDGLKAEDDDGIKNAVLSFALVLAHEFSSVEGQLHVFVVRLREHFIFG